MQLNQGAFRYLAFKPHLLPEPELSTCAPIRNLSHTLHGLTQILYPWDYLWTTLGFVSQGQFDVSIA